MLSLHSRPWWCEVSRSRDGGLRTERRWWISGKSSAKHTVLCWHQFGQDGDNVGNVHVWWSRDRRPSPPVWPLWYTPPPIHFLSSHVTFWSVKVARCPAWWRGDSELTPAKCGTLLHSDPMEVVSIRALLFLSAATTWCGQAEQEEDPLEGLGHEDKIRDALVSCLETQSAASCLPVGALTFSGLRFKKKKKRSSNRRKNFEQILCLFVFFNLPVISTVSSQFEVWRWRTRQT